MPAPKANINARKGEVNRQMWSQRLPIDLHEQIKGEAKRLDTSLANVVTAWGRFLRPQVCSRPAGGLTIILLPNCYPAFYWGGTRWQSFR